MYDDAKLLHDTYCIFSLYCTGARTKQIAAAAFFLFLVLSKLHNCSMVGSCRRGSRRAVLTNWMVVHDSYHVARNNVLTDSVALTFRKHASLPIRKRILFTNSR